MGDSQAGAFLMRVYRQNAGASKAHGEPENNVSERSKAGGARGTRAAITGPERPKQQGRPGVMPPIGGAMEALPTPSPEALAVCVALIATKP